MPGFHHSVAVLPLPFRRCRFCTPLPFPLTLRIFAVYGCNGTKFSYVIFTEQRNFTMAELTAKRQRKNGNGMVETGHNTSDVCRRLYVSHCSVQCND